MAIMATKPSNGAAGTIRREKEACRRLGVDIETLYAWISGTEKPSITTEQLNEARRQTFVSSEDFRRFVDESGIGKRRMARLLGIENFLLNYWYWGETDEYPDVTGLTPQRMQEIKDQLGQK